MLLEVQLKLMQLRAGNALRLCWIFAMRQHAWDAEWAFNRASCDICAQQFFDLADAYLLVKQNESDPKEILERNLRNKPFFLVTPQEHFISPEVIEFVKRRIDQKDTKDTKKI